MGSKGGTAGESLLCRASVKTNAEQRESRSMIKELRVHLKGCQVDLLRNERGGQGKNKEERRRNKNGGPRTRKKRKEREEYRARYKRRVQANRSVWKGEIRQKDLQKKGEGEQNGPADHDREQGKLKKELLKEVELHSIFLYPPSSQGSTITRQRTARGLC